MDDEHPDNNLIEDLAGAMGVGSVGDGDIHEVSGLSSPSSVRLDAGGSVYLADTRNHRLRRFFPSNPQPLGTTPDCPEAAKAEAPPCLPAGAQPTGGN